ncbi:hypothetical protein VTO42DRAFT_724 [Malbranchea cinnamomea]
MDKSLNNLLKWSIENSAAAADTATGTEEVAQHRQRLDLEALQRLLNNAPSEAELMKAAMEVIRDPDATLENKLIAFDNFEQLIESLDNANNMEVLGLWTPLVETLDHAEAEMRKMAAWCIGTAVQNNPKSQDKLLVFNAIPILFRLSQSDPEHTVRKKAIYALSSAVRNHQPCLDELRRHLPADVVAKDEKIDAGDMERIDRILAKLRGE